MPTHSFSSLLNVKTLLLISALLFSPCLFFDFVNLDDPSHLDNNPYVHSFSAKNVEKLWAEPYLKLYIPLTYTAWSLLALVSPSQQIRSASGAPNLSRFSPFPFHLMNFLLHLICVFFVFRLLEILYPGNPQIFWAAALFAFHPLQVEPVAWVSGLKDVLSGALYLAALYLVLKDNPLYLLCLLGSLLSKPSAVTWPFVAGLFYYREKNKLLTRILPALLLCLPFAWMASRTQPMESFGFPIPHLTERIWIAFDSIGFYFSKLFLPLSLAVDYGRAPTVALHSSFFGVLGILVFLLSAMATWWRKSLRFPMLATLLLLFPVLGLRPFIFQTTSTVSDRYLYLTLFPLSCLLLSSCRGFKFKSIVAILLSLLAIRTLDQIWVWKDTPSLLGHTIKVNPRSWLAYNNLGSWNERKGSFQTALKFYEESARIKPQSLVYNNIGAVQMATGNYSQAADAYREGIRLNPFSSLDYLGLGMALQAMGKKDQAQEAFQQALHLQPKLRERLTTFNSRHTR